jgi:hypothetical protein
MFVFTVIVAILISAAAIAYVVWPLVRSGPAPIVIEDDHLTELMARKDAALAAIKDLEFDYRTAKLSEEDYQRMDQRLRRQAIGYMQQIEKLAPESAQMDGRIEAEIANLRKIGAAAPAPASQPTAGPAPAPPAHVDSAPAPTLYCTSCGKPVQPTHKFCAHCGAPVTAAVVTSNG